MIFVGPSVVVLVHFTVIEAPSS